MILAWGAAAPVLLAAIALVFAPGAIAARFVGLRGLGLLAFAPVLTVAATAIVAVLYGVVGVPWTLLTWAIAMLVLIGLAVLIGRWTAGRLGPEKSPSATWLLPTALMIGILLSAWRLVAYVQDPAGISQTNDAVFHLNAVRYVLETADASSLHVNSVIGGHSFYPSAWHGVVSLLVLLTGAPIPVVVNMFTVVIGALIWPLGIAWLARSLSGSSTVAAYAAVLSGSLQTFPLLMFQWGVLYPNALSTAMLPAAVATVITLPNWKGKPRQVASVVRAVLLVLIVVAALLLSQPAGFLPWAAMSAVWLTFWLFARKADLGSTRVVTIVVVMWLALVGVWLYLSTSTSGSHWPPFRGKLEVLLDVLFNGQVTIPFAFGVSALMLVGVVVAIRSVSLRWFAVSWIGVSVLYLIVAAIGMPFAREMLLGAWYADPYRIAAIAPVVVIPLAAVGADAILRVIAKRTGRISDSGSLAVAGLTILSIFMFVMILVRPVAMPAATQGTFDRESRYLATPDSFLDPDERELLENLADHVPADARILGNPSTGSGFGYFLSGRDVYPRTWANPTSAAWQEISSGLRDVGSDPEICEALAIFGSPEYVLDFGPGDDSPGRYVMPGMTDFVGQPGFELVYSVGEVSLWRITACAQ